MGKHDSAQPPQAPASSGLISEPHDRQALLTALRDSLRVWEERVDLSGLDQQKQAALAELASTTVETLKQMIAELQADIERQSPEQG